MAKSSKRSRRHYFLRAILLAVGVCAAVVALCRTDLAGIRSAVWQTGPIVLYRALAFSLGGMAAMGFYDVFALRTAAPGRVSDSFAWQTGVKAYGISNLLGFAILTGGAVRYPIYRAKGVDIGALTNAMAMSWAAFWLAVTGIVGGLLTFHPGDAEVLLAVAPETLRVAGVTALCFAGGVLLMIATGTQVLQIRQWRILFPTLRLALAQTLVALVELLLAAAALYALMPAFADLTFTGFFAAYVLAVSVGLISHSPGGLGAFEATLLFLTGIAASAPVIAALLIYRLVRFLIPFALACLWLAADWAIARFRRSSLPPF